MPQMVLHYMSLFCQDYILWDNVNIIVLSFLAYQVHIYSFWLWAVLALNEDSPAHTRNHADLNAINASLIFFIENVNTLSDKLVLIIFTLLGLSSSNYWIYVLLKQNLQMLFIENEEHFFLK